MEGLQKFLKMMSNEMVEIKKQVAKTSTKRQFRNFKRNKPTDPRPPNAISNAESNLDDYEDEDNVLSAEEMEENETVECHGMWDFILLNSDNESEQEALLGAKVQQSLMKKILRRKNQLLLLKTKLPQRKLQLCLPTINHYPIILPHLLKRQQFQISWIITLWKT